MKMKLIAIAVASLLFSLLFLGISPASSEDQILMTSVEGTVTDAETGEPLAEAEVFLMESGGYGKIVSTDEDGYYIFEFRDRGSYYLVVSKDGYDDGYAEVFVNIGDNEVVDFQLTPLQFKCSVYGMIYDLDTGDPLQGGVVLSEVDGEARNGTRTEEDGKFFLRVEPGIYILTANVNSSYPRYVSEEFQLLTGDEKEINVPMEMYSQGVMGTVLDPDGDPIKNAKVYIENDEWRSSDSTDGNGEYEIWAPAGSYELQINRDGCRPYRAEVSFNEGELIEHNAQLEKAVFSPIINMIRDIYIGIIGH